MAVSGGGVRLGAGLETTGMASFTSLIAMRYKLILDA